LQLEERFNHGGRPVMLPFLYSLDSEKQRTVLEKNGIAWARPPS
jgi:hypothetical protein